MNLKKLILLSLLFLSIASFSQNKKDSIPATQINLLKTNYKDFVVADKLVYAITNGDSLVVLNLKSDKIKISDKRFSTIAKNSRNRIVGVTKDGIVMQQISKNRYKTIDNVEGKVYKVLVDKNDDVIVVTDKYVRYKKENFVPKKGSPMYRMGFRPTEKLVPIDVVFLDKEERIWFGYDRGEFGGRVCFFDLKSKTFYADERLRSNYEDKYGRWPNKLELLKEFPDKVKVIDNDTLLKFPNGLYLGNIKGITQDANSNFYFSESLMHFFVRGSLSKLSKTEYVDFYNKKYLKGILEHDKGSDGKEMGDVLLEYLGPISYNRFNDKVYYYSDKGFFKIVEKDNNYSKEFIFRPWIYWTAGLADAVGYQMNVSKFEFISENEMIFLTSKNGIGYFDGKTVKYFM